MKRSPLFNLIPLLLGLILALFTVVHFFTIYNRVFSPQNLVYQGQLRLNNQTIHSQTIIPLDGGWTFYPNQLLTPRDLANTQESHGVSIRVPSVWGQGYGTYVLNITRSSDQIEHLNAIYVPSISSAYRMWINGINVRSAGKIGTSRNATEPQDKPGIFTIPQRSGHQIQVVVEVSNFIQQKGGIGESLYIGNLNALQRMEYFDLGLQLFIIGSLFTMAIFSISRFFSYRQDISPLFFALLCGDVVVQALFLNNSTFTTYLPTIGWVLESKIQYISIPVGLVLLLLTTRTIYPKETLPKVDWAFFFVCSLFTLTYVFTPPWIYTYGIDVVSLVASAELAYILSIFIRGVRRHRPYAGLNLVSIVPIVLTAINDLLYYSNVIHSFELLPAGFFIYVILQSIVYSLKHARASMALADKTEQLIALNEDLEARTKERTRELSNALEELSKSNELLNRLAMRDSLTSVPNRRFFHMAILEMQQQELNPPSSLSLFLIDVDYFKQYNDSYGHLAGDDCLKWIARTLETCVRDYPGALLARFGGEEFVAVLPDLDWETHNSVAEQLLASIRDLKIPHISSPIASRVSISIGGVRVPMTPDMKIEWVLNTADELLYSAKRNGRNQAIVDDMAVHTSS